MDPACRTGLLGLVLALAVAGGASGCGAEERSVPHVLGETTVSGTPERIVVLDSGELDGVTALGVTPLGATHRDDAPVVPAHIADALGSTASQIRDVGSESEPDLAAIAALEPDLILASEAQSGLYAELSAIAPTVVGSGAGEDWKTDFVRNADALDRRGDADRVLSDYEAQADEVGAAYGQPATVTVSAVRLDNGLQVADRASFVGTVLEDVGFSRPFPEESTIGLRTLPVTALSRIAGGVLFYAAAPGDDVTLRAVTGSRTWAGLPSVAGGRAIAVPDAIWFQADGPLGARLVLGDLLSYASRVTGNA